MSRLASKVLVTFSLLCLYALGIAASPSQLKSIRPLQWKNREGNAETVCTTWATRLNDITVWVTAYHCVSDAHGHPYLDETFLIDGRRVFIRSANAELDLATLSGPPASGLFVSFKAPDVLSYVWTAGYPAGPQESHKTPHLHITAGVFSLPHDGDGRALYNTAVTFGMSGSPVMNKDGIVVGLVQQMECHIAVGFCPMSRGATVPQLRLFLYGE